MFRTEGCHWLEKTLLMKGRNKTNRNTDSSGGQGILQIKVFKWITVGTFKESNPLHLPVHFHRDPAENDCPQTDIWTLTDRCPCRDRTGLIQSCSATPGLLILNIQRSRTWIVIRKSLLLN